MLWFRSRSFWPSGGIVRSLKSQTPTPPSLQGQACHLLAFLSYGPSSSPAKLCTIALGLSYLHSENEVFPTVSKSTHFWNYRFRRQWQLLLMLHAYCLLFIHLCKASYSYIHFILLIRKVLNIPYEDLQGNFGLVAVIS